MLVGCGGTGGWVSLREDKEVAEGQRGGPSSTLLSWGHAAIQGAFSLRSQLDFHVTGVGLRASPSLRPRPSEERLLSELSIRTDQETSFRRRGWSGFEAGHRLQ